MSAKRKSAKTAKKTAKKAAKKVAASRAAPRAAKKPAKKVAARKASRPRAAAPGIVHWEIQSQTPEKLHGFYADVFGWKVDANNEMKYGMVASGGKEAINGGIGGSPSPGSRVVVYANVPDINATLQRIEELGGRTVMPRTDIGMVIMALYLDPEGNTMGIIEI